MRRVALFLSVVMALVTLGAAPAQAATTITRFQLTSAGLIAKGVAVQLTFKAGCRNFEEGAFGIIQGRVEERVRGQLVSTPIGEASNIERCGASQNLTAVGGRQPGTFALHPGSAVIDATFTVCDYWGQDPCPHVAHVRTSTSLVPLPAKPPAPDPLEPDPFDLGLRLIAARLVGRGQAVDMELEVTCHPEESGSCSFATGFAAIDQNVQGIVVDGYADLFYDSPTSLERLRITLRIPASDPKRPFKHTLAAFVVYVEMCFDLGCPTARISGVMRPSR